MEEASKKQRKHALAQARRGSRAYEELDPAVEWRQVGDEQDVVEISLPEFRKEQVRVQVDNHGVLRATGERPAAARGGKWVRFKKDLRLPDNCDVDAVRAKFEDHKLIIVLPIVADHDAAASPSSLSSPSPSPGMVTPPQSPPPPPPPPRPRPSAVKDTVVEPKPPPPRPSPPLQTPVEATGAEPKQPPPPAPAAAPEPTKPTADKPRPSSPPVPRWELPRNTLPVPKPPPPSRYWDPAPATAPEPTKPGTDKPMPSSPPRWELPKIAAPGARAAAGGEPKSPPPPSSPLRWKFPKNTLPAPSAQAAADGESKPSLPYKPAETTVPDPNKVERSPPPPPPPGKKITTDIPQPKLKGRETKETKDSEAQEEEDGKVGRPLTSKRKKGAPAETDKTAAAAREERELLVNMAAAVAVLVGITVFVWRTLSSS
ncbi:hypothetical protein ABZP36_010618 [Zizania latifolia]